MYFIDRSTIFLLRRPPPFFDLSCTLTQECSSLWMNRGINVDKFKACRREKRCVLYIPHEDKLFDIDCCFFCCLQLSGVFADAVQGRGGGNEGEQPE